MRDIEQLIAAMYRILVTLLLLQCLTGRGLSQEQASSYTDILHEWTRTTIQQGRDIFGSLFTGNHALEGPTFTGIKGLDTPDAVPYLILILQNGPDFVDEDLERITEGRYLNVARSLAALCLGNIGDARALGPLIEALNDEDPGIRHYTALALGYLGDPRAIDPLITRAKEGDETYWFYALSRIGVPRAAEAIIEHGFKLPLHMHASVDRSLQNLLRMSPDNRMFRSIKGAELFPQRGQNVKNFWTYWIRGGGGNSQKTGLMRRITGGIRPGRKLRTIKRPLGFKFSP